MQIHCFPKLFLRINLFILWGGSCYCEISGSTSSVYSNWDLFIISGICLVGFYLYFLFTYYWYFTNVKNRKKVPTFSKMFLFKFQFFLTAVNYKYIKLFLFVGGQQTSIIFRKTTLSNCRIIIYVSFIKYSFKNEKNKWVSLNRILFFPFGFYILSKVLIFINYQLCYFFPANI